MECIHKHKPFEHTRLHACTKANTQWVPHKTSNAGESSTHAYTHTHAHTRIRASAHELQTRDRGRAQAVRIHLHGCMHTSLRWLQCTIDPRSGHAHTKMHIHTHGAAAEQEIKGLRQQLEAAAQLGDAHAKEREQLASQVRMCVLVC